MEFRYGEKEETLRQEIREFVRENLPPDMEMKRFQEEHFDDHWAFSMQIAKKLSQKGWLTMGWPEEYGGMGASVWERCIFTEEAGYWNIPGIGMGVGGTGWIGPSLMLFGTDEQKKKFLPLIASGDDDGVWCTGYSEPDAGSDFASLQTRAERVGGEYVINGQKVWNSAGHRARWCWLACRTDPGAKRKHDGISTIIVDLKSEGVTIRPIPNIVGLHNFNEIFFKDVRVPVENLVGEENNGWRQLMRALAFERGISLGAGARIQRVLEELIEYTKESGEFKRPEIRQQLAEIAVEIRALRLMALETADKVARGDTVIYETSRDRSFNNDIMEKLSVIGTEILGPYSQVDPLQATTKWTRIKGLLEDLYWATPGTFLATGTMDTQRNIIGQFGLGLPKSY